MAPAAKIEVEVTQEMIDKNPAFAAKEGVSVGDVLSLTKKEAAALEEGEAPKAPEGRVISNGGTAILRDGQEFIRVYPKGFDEDAIAGFVNKSPKYSTMPANKIGALVVEYEATKPDPARPTEKILYREETKFTRADYGEDMFAQATLLRNQKPGGVIKWIKA